MTELGTELLCYDKQLPLGVVVTIFEALQSEVERVAMTTTFNGLRLLSSSEGPALEPI